MIKAVCKGTTITLTTPFSGNVGVILNVGTDTKRYCASFGGENKKNDIKLIKKRVKEVIQHLSPAVSVEGIYDRELLRVAVEELKTQGFHAEVTTYAGEIDDMKISARK